MLESGWLEFRVSLSKIVTLELCVLVNCTTQQSAAERAIGEGSHRVFPAPWQNVLLCLPFEKVERRLGRGERGNAAEVLHGFDGVVGDANRTDLSGLLKIKKSLGGFFIGGNQIRPMDLVKINIVGAQAPE